MADLNAQVPNALSSLLMTPEQQKAYEDQLVQRAQYGIERNANNQTLAQRETDFGRGMGLSTLNAYAQGQIERARAEALSKAQIDANTAVRQAQQAAVGQAASYAAGQQARAQQESQFSRGLAQQKSMHTQNMVAGGLAGLAGMASKGAGLVYGDKIKKLLGGGPGEATPGAGPYGSAQPPSGQGTGDVRKAELQMNPDMTAGAQMPGTTATASPQLSDLSGSDLSGYSPSSSYGSDYTSYNPQEFDMSSGWGSLASLLGNNDQQGWY